MYLCSNRETGAKYACKVVIVSDNVDKSVDAAQVLNEIKVISNLDHPNIVKFHEVYARGAGIFVVMELLKGGNLLDVFIDLGADSYTEGDCVIIFRYTHHFHDLACIHQPRPLFTPSTAFIFADKFSLPSNTSTNSTYNTTLTCHAQYS